MRAIRSTAWLGSVVTVVAVGAVGLAAPAQAAIDAKPARTWGIGPATTTSASVGKPRVLAILPVGDRVFVGGTFDSVLDPQGNSYPVKNLAVFSASTGVADLSWRVTPDATVTSLASDGSRLFIGGTFAAVNGGQRRGLAAVSTATGALDSWSPTVTGGQVDAITYAGGAVYAGGNFASVNSSSGASQAFAAKIDASSGAVDTSWDAAPNDRVRALNVAADGTGRLYVGGDFTAVSAKSGTNKLAAVRLAAPGAVDTAFRAGPTNASSYSPVYDITSNATNVFTASAGSGGACASLSSTSGATAWSAHSNGNMQSVRLLHGLLYCAGHYGGDGSFMGQNRNKLAAVVASTGALTAFAPRINSSQGPWALAASPGRLFMGGDFSKISGVLQPHYAVFVDTSLQSRPQPPRSLTAEPGNASVTLAWSPPSSDGGSALQKYRIFRSTSPGGQALDRSPLVSLSKDQLTYRDTTAANGVTHYYVVVATNALGSSAPSNEASATPSASSTVTAPSAPTSVTGIADPGVNHIAWNPPSTTGGSAVTSYRVYRSGSATGTFTQVGTTADRFFDDSAGLTAGATYYYAVSAVNAVGEGPRSASVAVTAAIGRPGAPTLTVTATAAPSATLKWTIPPDGGSPITKYVILRDSVRLVTLSATSSGGPTSYVDTSVSPRTTYTYQVRAANIEGNGENSDKVSVRIP
jgi:fibronectin type 3 domain-containing protein